MHRSIAALGKSLRPGLIVLGVTLVSYWLLRAGLPEKALAPPLIYASGMLLSLVMLSKGFGAWVQTRTRTADSPDARARFVRSLDQWTSTNLPPAPEALLARATEMKEVPLPDAFDGCWSFSLPSAFEAYEVEGFLLLSDQQLCIGVIGGVKGEWYETRHLYTPVEREGCTLTAIGSCGSLEWLPAGSHLVIDFAGGDEAQLSWRAGVYRMKRASVPESLKRFIPALSAG